MKGAHFTVLLIVTIVLSLDVSASTNVMLTVDVESLKHKYGNPRANILGQLNGYDEAYGVPKILDILDEYDAKATFYLNVYELSKFGDAELREIANEIVQRSQDLQLHTHPMTMYGKWNMSDFDLPKQIEILQTGKGLIKEWTGNTVIAHRAGRYMADLNTLKALKIIGLVSDSSLSPAIWSPLNQAGYTENDILEIDGLLEIPVTSFAQIQFGTWKSLRIVEMERSSLMEIKHVLSSLADQNACIANIMAHSFSFTRYGEPDPRIGNKMRAVLSFVAGHPDLEMLTTEEFVEAYRQQRLDCTPSPAFVPHTGMLMTYLRSWERIGDGWKNVVFAVGIPAVQVVLLLIAGILGYWIVRRV